MLVVEASTTEPFEEIAPTFNSSFLPQARRGPFQTSEFASREKRYSSA